MHLPSPVTAEHIGYAVIRLREIERQTAHGGKAGTALARARLDQKRHIEDLLDAFEGQAVPVVTSEAA